LNQIAPVVLVNESACVAKNFCALELATTSALQAIFARRALRGMDSEDSGPGRHEKKEQKRGIRIPDSGTSDFSCDGRSRNLAVVGYFDLT